MTERASTCRAGPVLVLIAALLLASCGSERSPTTGSSAASVSLASAKRFHGVATYYLGRSFAGLPLTATPAPTEFIYGDCTPPLGAEEASCEPPLAVQNASICERYPLRYQFAARLRVTPMSGALIARIEGGADIYTGETAVTVFNSSRASLAQVIRALRPLRGARGRALPPPRFPREMRDRIAAAEHLFARTHSVSYVHRRLQVSRSAVRAFLALGETLRRFGDPRLPSC